MIMSLKQKKRKIKPRIKLNHNIYKPKTNTLYIDLAKAKSEAVLGSFKKCLSEKIIKVSPLARSKLNFS